MEVSGSVIPEQTGTNAPPADIINNGYEDVVGWLPVAVNYYRSQMRAPCSFSATQQMSYRLCKRVCCLHREWPWSNDWHYYSLEFETGPNPNANVAMMIR
jgi:hypothetical protein